jgi:multidrug efflux pump subunit AcrA (membrane-fusion protein)
MAAWKQILIALVILGAAGAAWAKMYPGAPEILARWGIEWAAPAAPQQAAGEARGGTGSREGGGPRRPQTAVVTAPVQLATINERLQAIGTGRANASVTVVPYDSGRLIEVAVSAGGRVEKGQVVARLDADAEEIALDRARLAEEDALAKLERANSLRRSNAATPVQVAEAEMARNNARLALRDAELALGRRSIVAPIAGIVGILPVETGNWVTSQTAVATIDDRSSIVIDFWVPERYASAVDRLRAGMSFQVEMRFPGDTYPSVDPLAIQWGTDGAFVWAVEQGRARRTPVRIIQRNTENVLVDGDLAEADQVVIEGIYVVREGAELLIARDEATPAVGVARQSGS